ncbi:MAG TPA: ABC transporter substrate-binding protein, partial [Burkholderiales bacterium]|nr:ABC transporter substrate-binding protein [Burkholderiales bacterium]
MVFRKLALAASIALGTGTAHAQISDGVIKIGVLNDQSSLYADISGQGGVVAAKMAVEDFGAAKKGMKVEIISADHQNKPEVGSAIARQWYDVDKVDVIVDVPTSSVALAINQVTREKNKLFLVSGAASSDLTGKACSPNTIHWTYDTWMLAHGTGSAIVKTGGKSWFFLTADYAFGHALERDTEEVVVKEGGKVLGKVRHPLNAQDFSSFLLQAQSSKAQVIGLANAGGDTWFFLTADYAFGAALERDVTKVVEQSGGKVLGEVKHPLNASDFSSFLLQAQSSKAKIIGLANAGGDTINVIKASSEFGIMAKGQKLASLLVFISDVNALGLETAQGLTLSEAFYWDRDDKTRAWSQKFAAKHGGAMPTMVHAGVYASVKHYLKAIAELKGAKDGKAVV